MKFLQDSEDAKAKRKVLGSFMLSWNITLLCSTFCMVSVEVHITQYGRFINFYFLVSVS